MTCVLIKPCVYKRCSRTSGGGLLVLHLEDIPFIGNNDGKIVSNGSMVSHSDRYEGLKKSQSHPWDQTYVKSSDKDVGLNPKSSISTLFLSGLACINSKKGFVPLTLGKILSSYQQNKTHAEIDKYEKRSRCLGNGMTHRCNTWYLLCLRHRQQMGLKSWRRNNGWR